MLRTLLTPLRAHVDTSPRTAKTSSLASVLDDNELAPEEFAREVMMELMRNSVENLKLAQDIETKTQVRTEQSLLQPVYIYDLTSLRFYLRYTGLSNRTGTRKTCFGSWMDF